MCREERRSSQWYLQGKISGQQGWEKGKGGLGGRSVRFQGRRTARQRRNEIVYEKTAKNVKNRRGGLGHREIAVADSEGRGGGQAGQTGLSSPGGVL